MGRGLVHPIDALHAANPPSHPELLDALAGGFVANRFSLKWLLREICLSDAYGRSSQAPGGLAPAAIALDSYRVASLRPLSPEQMARSFLLATGNLDAVRSAPAPENQFVFKDYVNGHVAEPPSNLRDVLTFFVAVFGNPPGEPEVGFNASTEQALFLMNERFIASWLEPRDGNLIGDLTKLDGADAIAEELWLRVLTRWPEPEEVELVKELLDGSDPRATVLRDLAWSLLMGAEFRLNH